jgi:large subunit ribosomal protein L17
MRHGNKGRKLGRTASHRKATLSSLSVAVIRHKKIRTTTAKAKEARMVVEKLITRAKRAVAKEGEGKPKDVHARREVFAFLRDREAVTTLFNEIAPKVVTRAGGYTRVVKLGRRQGDGGEVAIVELVDYNIGQEKAAPKPKAKAAAARKRGPKKGKPDTSKKAEEVNTEDAAVKTPAPAEPSDPQAAESNSK